MVPSELAQIEDALLSPLVIKKLLQESRLHLCEQRVRPSRDVGNYVCDLDSLQTDLNAFAFKVRVRFRNGDGKVSTMTSQKLPDKPSIESVFIACPKSFMDSEINNFLSKKAVETPTLLAGRFSSLKIERSPPFNFSGRWWWGVWIAGDAQPKVLHNKEVLQWLSVSIKLDFQAF